MADQIQRNMVQRLDGRLVNAGRKRGMLTVCAMGCCCGHTDRGYAPVWPDLHHDEWERRRLRNRVHLNMGGCLGPCPLANVALLLFDGRPIWFHSLNDQTLIIALYDYIDAILVADAYLPPVLLAPHVFNGFAWDGVAQESYPPTQVTQQVEAEAGNGMLVLTQADTDLLMLDGARSLLPTDFGIVRAANVGRLTEDHAIDRLLDEVLPGTGVVVQLLSGARSFTHGIARLQAWSEQTGGFLLCLPAADALDPELMALSNVGMPLAHVISAYLQSGGAENVANGLQCLSDHLLITGWGYDPPRELPRHGVYEPASGCACCQPQLPANASTVGVLFYRAHLLSGNTAFVDAIIAELAAQGLRARAVFTQSLKEGDDGPLPTALHLLTEAGPIDAFHDLTPDRAYGDGGDGLWVFARREEGAA